MTYVTPSGNTETHKKFKRRLYKGFLILANAERGTASHPDTPDNPLDTRMDHTTHSLDTWAPKIPMVHSNPWHRTYQRTASGNPPFRYRTLQPVRENGPPLTPNHILWPRSHNMELDPHQNRSCTPHRPPLYTGRLENPPLFPLLAPQMQASIFWIIAHLVEYRMQRKGRLTLNDCIDFLRRAKWKAYQKSPRHHRVGNYLDILLDTGTTIDAG
jgi:hypothetical protein